MAKRVGFKRPRSSTAGASSVKTLSSTAPKEVGRPGFKTLGAPVAGRRGIRRLVKNDPASGLRFMLSNITGVGRTGGANYTELSANHTPAPGTGKRRIRDRSANRKLDTR